MLGEAAGGHGRPLEIRYFENGNTGGSLLGTLRATMPREATGRHGEALGIRNFKGGNTGG